MSFVWASRMWELFKTEVTRNRSAWRCMFRRFKLVARQVLGHLMPNAAKSAIKAMLHSEEISASAVAAWLFPSLFASPQRKLKFHAVYKQGQWGPSREPIFSPVLDREAMRQNVMSPAWRMRLNGFPVDAVCELSISVVATLPSAKGL